MKEFTLAEFLKSVIVIFRIDITGQGSYAMISGKKLKFCTILSFLMLSSPIFASLNSNTLLTPPKSKWELDIAPYIWALNMNGRVGLGPVTTHINQDFSDILHHLNWAGMVWLDVKYDHLDLFLNSIYAVLSADDTRPLVSADAQNQFGLFTLGGAYEVYKTCFKRNCAGDLSSFAISPYIGVRYTLNDTTVKLKLPEITLKGTKNVNWTDPIIGARLNFKMTKAWSAIIAGDVGGTNTVSHYSYNVSGLLGYNPQTHWTSTTMYLGYRLLDQRYTTGRSLNDFNWDMKLFGPIVGIAIAF
jgi:hypothetical protein